LNSNKKYEGGNIMHNKVKKLTACLLMTALVVLGTAYNVSAAAPYAVVTAYNQVRNRYTNTIYPNVRIYTTEDLDLSELTIHYWFVVDQDYYDYEQFFCDYAHMSGPWQNTNITSKVSGWFQDVTRPDPSGAPAINTHMLTISFDESAGTLKAGSTLELKCRFAAPDWSLYDQYNDPSFNPAATYYVPGNYVIAVYMGYELN
jgi:hypothetical protein